MKLSKPWLVPIALISADSKMLVLFWLSNKTMEIPHHSPFSWALCLGNRWVAKRSFQSKVYSNTEFTPRKEASRNQLFKRLRIFHHSKHLQKCNLQKCGGRPPPKLVCHVIKNPLSCKKRTIFLKFKVLASLKLTVRP